MSNQMPTTFPPTLIFNSVDGFLEAVQRRVIDEIGCATLKRITPCAEGMLQRHTSFMLLTARDPIRDEVLVCSVFLKAGDFMDDKHLFTPASEWERQTTRAEAVRRQVLLHVHAVPNLRVLDAAYHVYPGVAMRFATFTVQEEPGAGNA